jgi:hypothetical protein
MVTTICASITTTEGLIRLVDCTKLTGSVCPTFWVSLFTVPTSVERLLFSEVISPLRKVTPDLTVSISVCSELVEPDKEVISTDKPYTVFCRVVRLEMASVKSLLSSLISASSSRWSENCFTAKYPLDTMLATRAIDIKTIKSLFIPPLLVETITVTLMT